MADPGIVRPRLDQRLWYTVTGKLNSSENVRSMVLMTMAMGVFVLNDTLTKTVSTNLATGQIITIRGLISALLMLPLVHFTCGLGHAFSNYSRPLLVRNICEMGAVVIFLSAIFRLPIVDVTAILQILPLVMTAAAALVLKETVGWRRWSAAIIGLAGVLLIIQPGGAGFSWWYIAALVAVVLVAMRDLATRFIAKDMPTAAVTFLTTLAVTVAGMLLGQFETWTMPSTSDLLRLTAAAVLVLIGYATLIEAWRTGEVSATAPMRYSVVLWAMLFGYVFLGEVPSALTLLGSAIVIAAGLYTFAREQQRALQT